MFIEHGDLFLKYINDEEKFQRELDALESIFSETRVPVGGRVLDLCCGSGTQALNLAKKGFNVTRVDFSPIERAEGCTFLLYSPYTNFKK